jgi:hypothetical protein
MKYVTMITMMFILSFPTAAQRVVERDVDSSNKYMLSQSGIKLEKAGNLKMVSFGLQAGAGLVGYLGARESLVNGYFSPLVPIASVLMISGIACKIGSAVQLKRSGLYLQAYYNGIIITF